MEEHKVEELAKRYWELQNYITGFAIAQMLVVIMAAETNDSREIK